MKAQEIFDVIDIAARGKDWTLYKLTAENGGEYTTFDETWKEKLGQPVEFEYDEVERPSKKGDRVFINKRIRDPKKPVSREISPHKEIKRALDTNDEIVNLLKGLVEISQKIQANIDASLKGLREIYKGLNK